MDLTETSPFPSAALPLDGFRAHLRLGAGFDDTATDASLLEDYLRAAIAQVEARTGRALLTRDFRLSLRAWRNGFSERLPVAPVVEITSVTLFNAVGVAMLVSPARTQLDADGMRPALEAVGSALPHIPTGGRVEIAFRAGFGPVWGDVPADLRQAVMLLAAGFYEGRDGAGLEERAGIQALLERWRDIRIGGRR